LAEKDINKADRCGDPSLLVERTEKGRLPLCICQIGSLLLQ